MQLAPQPLPAAYADLDKEHGPKMLLAALSYYGLHEAPGGADNPTILQWAKDLGITSYDHDATPWCGLAMAKFASMAGKDLKAAFPQINQILWALGWARFGHPSSPPALGDVLVFKRPGGGHVGLYVGEDADAFHVLGGNEGDAVTIVRVARIRLFATRRPIYQTQPPEVRVIKRSASGALSGNES